MSKAQAIPWFEPAFDATDERSVAEVVATTFVNEGPKTREFEKELCLFFGVDFAVAVPNCTIALALSLKALGIGAGDTVIVPTVTFVGTASAVRLVGAEPILADVDSTTFTMDPCDARRKLRPSTKAVIPVHLNGRSADMAALRSLADEAGLAVVEDAAEAMASRNVAGYLGTQSDAGCFSLAPTKIITSGQGGFVLTNSADIRDNIIRLKDHGRLSRSSDVHPVTGFNFKFTDLQAGLALSQFRRLPERIERALEVDRLYREHLGDAPHIFFPARPINGGYLMWPDFQLTNRDALVEHMASCNIALRPFWPPLHCQPAYATGGAYPGAEDACRRTCWLPCSPEISNSQIERVCYEIQHFL